MCDVDLVNCLGGICWFISQLTAVSDGRHFFGVKNATDSSHAYSAYETCVAFFFILSGSLVNLITLDEDIAVSALTTAMSEPHLIDYTLHFDSATLQKK